jgi:hypothetical protein
MCLDAVNSCHFYVKLVKRESNLRLWVREGHFGDLPTESTSKFSLPRCQLRSHQGVEGVDINIAPSFDPRPSEYTTPQEKYQA